MAMHWDFPGDTEETLADKWIKEMQEWGLAPDQMLEVIQLAKEKYKLLKQ